MKNLIIIIAFGLLTSVLAAQDYTEVQQNAFKRGEKLTFKLYYKSAVTGNVSAGELTSEIKPNKVYIANRPSYHVVLDGRTKGAFNWFFKIRDRFESFIDEDRLLPHYFKKRIQEGDYETKRDVHFDIDSGVINYHNLKSGSKGVVNTELEVQDLVSSLYYIRNWNFGDTEKGDKFNLNLFLDDSVYQIEFEYQGIEVVKTNLGKIECIKFKPRVLTGGVFGDENPMTIYVSNDANHLPILAVSEVMIGSVRMELTDYEGLRHLLHKR